MSPKPQIGKRDILLGSLSIVGVKKSDEKIKKYGSIINVGLTPTFIIEPKNHPLFLRAIFIQKIVFFM